jgi:hypothetical protein
VLASFHWLCVAQRVQFELAVSTFHAMKVLTPGCIIIVIVKDKYFYS